MKATISSLSATPTQKLIKQKDVLTQAADCVKAAFVSLDWMNEAGKQ